MNTNENLSPLVMSRLMREIRELWRSPTEGITVHFDEDNMTNIRADLDGPVDTPFYGGKFQVRLVLGSDFPNAPPKGFFLTKIFHPNVSSKGEICVNTLKRDWKPSHGIKHILMVIRCLLIVPNPESALNPDAGKMLLEDYEAFAKRARLMTRIHAKPKAERKQARKDGDDGGTGTGDDGADSSTRNAAALSAAEVAASSAASLAIALDPSTPSKKKKRAAKKKRKIATKKRGLKRL